MPAISSLVPLPIDAILPQIMATLASGRDLVLTAPPGAGKTTRVPRYLYECSIAHQKEILILEPRRIAARLAAMRVAEEMGEKVGATVGYSVRFEHVASSSTRVRFVTEAVLLRMALQDSLLSGVATIILDEFHERHVATDVALALARKIQREKRPDLRIAVMSATMDPAPIADYLSNAAVLTAEGILHEIALEYHPVETEAPLHEQVGRAVTRILTAASKGNTLVFLPGAAEIRRAAEVLRDIAAQMKVDLVPLHGDLTPADQHRAVEPGARPKVVLATNVAESSITIPGVTAVVDSGLARISGYSPWSGLPHLNLAKISRASAAQRAGRAGRTGPGRVLRLYTRNDFEARPASEIPEIRRADLTEVLLTLHGFGVDSARDFPWFDRPPEAALAGAEELLALLGAMDEGGAITPLGRRLLDFPVHPRLGRLIMEGQARGIARSAVRLASLIAERESLTPASLTLDPRGRAGSSPTKPLDLFELHAALDPAHSAALGFGTAAGIRASSASAQRVRRAIQQMEHSLEAGRRDRRVGHNEEEELLQQCILAGFPDRVARRRSYGSRDLLMAGGGTVRLAETAIAHPSDLMIAVDAEVRSEERRAGGGGIAIVRMATPIKEEWLASMFPDWLSETIRLAWNAENGRVDEVRQTLYRRLLLQERVRPAPPSEEAGAILADQLMLRGLSFIPDADKIETLRCRLEILTLHFPAESIPCIDDEAIRNHVRRICRGRTKLCDLPDGALMHSMLELLSQRVRHLLSKEVPERMHIGSQRSLRIQYERGKPPAIASRLQDFWGQQNAPRICSGRLPLTVHLLAPNGRPVQVTQDLAGFWARHYPGVRRELSRRYPKHSWPEPGKPKT